MNTQAIANELRFLCADIVQKANSGHPGAPMGLADIVTILSQRLCIDPSDPTWLNRDRIVFSGGHASALVYSMNHLLGYDLSLDDLKEFRQTGSKTPGHPEYREVPGVEITTGPLGQGIANAVGFALASKYAQNLLGTDVINHSVFCFCGDGDLQEGISYEACSLAGVHSPENLVLIYDSNEITIEGSTSLAWNENVKKRFEAQNWDVLEINGHNHEEISSALDKASGIKRPVLIIADTTIGKGSINKQGTADTHGAPLGDEEIRVSKEAAGLDGDKTFQISEATRKHFKAVTKKGRVIREEWERITENSYVPKTASHPANLAQPHPNPLLKGEGTKLEVSLTAKQYIEKLQTVDSENIVWPEFEEDKAVATRNSNGEILSTIGKSVEGFIGGSADLSPSTKTIQKHSGDFPNGKNWHFGVREHAMGAIGNALSLYGLFTPYTATFFVFSDYMKTAIRLAALMKLNHYFILTHDSIGVGEDGPTHQPVEHLSALRSMPGINVYRPATANENIECWKQALSQDGPAAFVLSRQNLPNYVFEEIIGGVENGAYLVKKVENPDITLVASGSELELALESAEHLEQKGKKVSVVSLPCYDIFDKQKKVYKNSILNYQSTIIGIEAANSPELYKYCDEVIGMTSFGASGKASELFEKFGLTVDGVVERIMGNNE